MNSTVHTCMEYDDRISILRVTAQGLIIHSFCAQWKSFLNILPILYAKIWSFYGETIDSDSSTLVQAQHWDVFMRPIHLITRGISSLQGLFISRNGVKAQKRVARSNKHFTLSHFGLKELFNNKFTRHVERSVRMYIEARTLWNISDCID